MIARCCAVLCVLLGAGCGDEVANRPPPGGPVQLTLWNRSQFELLEVRLHEGELYSAAPNQLQAPLPSESEVTFEAAPGTYVTVIRRKIDVGDTIALTTAQPLDEIYDGSTLVVFDEAFRLMPPAAE